LTFAAGAAWWALAIGLSPDYVGDMLGGMLLTGIGVGLTLPTLMATGTASLPPNAFATGSAVINMLRQVGLAVGDHPPDAPAAAIPTDADDPVQVVPIEGLDRVVAADFRIDVVPLRQRVIDPSRRAFLLRCRQTGLLVARRHTESLAQAVLPLELPRFTVPTRHSQTRATHLVGLKEKVRPRVFVPMNGGDCDPPGGQHEAGTSRQSEGS